MSWFIALFIVLHGLVHFWYVTLSLKLVEFRPEMGFTGRSWAFTSLLGDPAARTLAAVAYALAALGLAAGGIGALARGGWSQPVLVAAGALSAAAIVLFWDGSLERVVEKGLIGLLISLSIVVALPVVARYQAEMQGHRERMAALDSRIIETDCGPVEAAITGEGYPVLSIHGNGGGFDQGLGLAGSFIGEGFQVIAPSRFGYLRSPVPEGATVEMQADAYACLLDALGIERAAVMTSSAGVTSTVQFALRHPDRVSALVLHSPNAPGTAGLNPPPKPVFSAMMHSDFLFWALTTYLEPAMQSFVGVPKGFTLTPELQAEVRSTLASVLPVSDRGDGMVFDTFVSNPAINDGYPFEQVDVPTLVVSAVDDPMALHENARVLAESIPGARLLAVPDGGHLLLGHFDDVRVEITGFLRENTAVFAGE